MLVMHLLDMDLRKYLQRQHAWKKKLYSQLSINAPPLGPDTSVHLERVCIYRYI
jgi:hypothetical protein